MLARTPTRAPDLLAELSAAVGRVERAIAQSIPEPDPTRRVDFREAEAEVRRLLDLACAHARLEDVRQEHRERVWRWHITRLLDVIGLLSLVAAVVLGVAGAPLLHIVVPAATSGGAVGVPRAARFWSRARL